MTTQDIINMAVQRSNLNDPDLIPTAELLDYLTTYERAIFLDAARENPNFFGRDGLTSARAASTDSWSLTTAPGNIASITRVEVSAINGTVSGISVGTAVNIVDVRYPDAEIGPRIYVRNKTAYEYNNELQADSSNFVTRLKLFYSFLPTDKAALTDSMDLPDEHNLLVVLPLASLMAMRDQRPDEAALLYQEHSFHRALFLQQISVFDEATVRPLDKLAAASRRIELS
jgi:hypothetical protein